MKLVLFKIPRDYGKYVIEVLLVLYGESKIKNVI